MTVQVRIELLNNFAWMVDHTYESNKFELCEPEVLYDHLLGNLKSMSHHHLLG